MRNKNLFWGLFFILAAVLVIALQFGSFITIGFWSIAATVLLVGFILRSLFKLDFAALPIPAALLYMIYQKPLNFFYVKPWLLIGAAVLASIGLSLLLGGIKRHSHHRHVSITRENGTQVHAYSHGALEARTEADEGGDDNHPYARVRMGALSKYLHSSALETGHFESSLGALEVYFDQAQLSEQGADIYVDCSLGAITLYFPRGWRVLNNISTTLAGVDDDNRFANTPADAPTVRLTGNVSLGGIEIKYI